MGEDEKLSHRPFAELAGELGQDLKRRLRHHRKAQRDEAAEQARSRPRGDGRATTSDAGQSAGGGAPVDEAQLFRREMQGVRPLDGGNYVPDQRGRLGLPARQDDDAEAMAQLADLLTGRASFDFSSSDEHIEGISVGLDRRLLRRLRQGYFAVQAHIDLHGKTRQEARGIVEAFLVDSRARRRRCVLIVHGRGLNSKDQVPVLKESLKVWLAKGRIGRSVLAFCSARPGDGGVGAVYVLLRK